MVEWYVAVSLARHILHSPHGGRKIGTNSKNPSAILKLLVTYADDIVFYKPLLHAIIFLIEMAVATRLAAKFNSYYAERPGKDPST